MQEIGYIRSDPRGHPHPHLPELEMTKYLKSGWDPDQYRFLFRVSWRIKWYAGYKPRGWS